MNENEKSRKTVQQLLPVFEKINELYLSADEICESFAEQKEDLLDTNNHWFRKSFWISFGIFWGSSNALLIIGSLFSLLYKNATSIPAVFFAWPAALAITVFSFLRLKRHFKITPIARLEVLEVDTQEQLEAISAEIMAIFQDNEEAISSIPRDYRCYSAISYFEHLFENGHADSMKEALILYDEYVHRQEMLAENQAIIAQNQLQLEMLERVERSSRSAARSSAAAAVFSAINLFTSD